MAANQKQQPDRWMLEAFATSRAEFLRSFKNVDKFDLSQYTSAEQVYNAADAIQQKQGKTLKLRALARIKPYLDCLSQYQGVIEVFVQVQPEILALVWVRYLLLSPFRSQSALRFELTFRTSQGPIKLVLQVWLFRNESS